MAISFLNRQRKTIFDSYRLKDILDKDYIENSTDLTPDFQKRGGLIPVIVQEISTGHILMLGYANEEAVTKTIETGLATFYSTSRKELWTKGLTSGDTLKLINLLTDCDQDALIYQVEMQGSGACHTKNSNHQTRKSCFYRVYSKETDKLKFIEK